MINAVACLTICNTISLSVYAVEHDVTDRILAGFNNDAPDWYDVQNDGDDSYIEIAGARYSLSEMIRL